MQNDEKKNEAKAPDGIVSAELLEEEYEKRTVLSTSGPLKKERGRGGKGLKIVIAALVVALVVGGFLYSRRAADEDAALQASVTPAPSQDLRVKLIDKTMPDFDRVTVTLDSGESYTLKVTAALNESGQVTSLDEGADSPYQVVGRPEFALNPTRLTSLVRYATTLSASRLVAEDVTDFSEYGLDKPAVRVEFRYKDNSSVKLAFGSPVPTTNNAFYYLTVEGTGKVYMGYSGQYNLFHSTLNSLHAVPENTTITDATKVDSLYVERPGAEPLEIVHKEDSDNYLSFSAVQLVKPFVSEASSDRVSELFEGAVGIAIDSYAGTMEELQDVSGLDGEHRTLVRVTDDEGAVMEYYVGNVAEDGAHTYVAIDDHDVYLAKAETVSFVNKCTVQYTVDQFSGIVYIARVNSVVITTESDSYEMSIERKPGEDDKEIEEYFFDGESVDEKTFKKLYQEVIGSMVSKVSDDFHLTGDTVLKIEYSLNVDPGTYVIEFITYDDDYYAVRRADGLTVYLIKKDKVAAIADAMEKMRAGEFTAK